MAEQVLEREQTGVPTTACPYCSRSYAHIDQEGQPLDVPQTCKRCGSPMDRSKSRDFANQQATKEHDPQLRAMGKTIRNRMIAGPAGNVVVKRPEANDPDDGDDIGSEGQSDAEIMAGLQAEANGQSS